MSSLAKDTQWLDAVDQAELVRSGKVTPVELLDALGSSIKQLMRSRSRGSIQHEKSLAIFQRILQCHFEVFHLS